MYINNDVLVDCRNQVIDAIEGRLEEVLTELNVNISLGNVTDMDSIDDMDDIVDFDKQIKIAVMKEILDNEAINQMYNSRFRILESSNSSYSQVSKSKENENTS